MESATGRGKGSPVGLSAVGQRTAENMKAWLRDKEREDGNQGS